jgi:hypothetical protein
MPAHGAAKAPVNPLLNAEHKRDFTILVALAVDPDAAGAGADRHIRPPQAAEFLGQQAGV